MKSTLEPLPDAQLIYRDGRPASDRFQDVYFSHDGPAESYRVFINPARILKRIADTSLFTIVEFGFGTGMNFLALAHALSGVSTNCRVRFVSFEKFPLKADEITQALSPYEDELAFLAELVEQLPPSIPGWHRRYFLDGRLELSLFYGDVAQGMGEFAESDKRGVDSWFFDGFSPDRNPTMWDDELFKLISQLTKENGTVTSFSVAGKVKRALRANQFKVERIETSSQTKRHTLLACYEGRPFESTSVPDFVSVVGGGLAGVTVAYTLAMKGIQVELFERRSSLCTETSRIPYAIQHPRLSAAATNQALQRIHTYSHTQALTYRLSGVNQVGGLQLASDGMATRRMQDIANLMGDTWCTFHDSSSTAQLTNGLLNQVASFYPRSAILNVPVLCNAVISHDNIQLRLDAPQTLSLDPEVPTVWATGCSVLDEINELPLEIATLEGQVDVFSTSDSFPLRNIIVQNGYIAPLVDRIAVGSTYEYTPWGSKSATRTNMGRALQIYPEAQLRPYQHFRSARVITTDRFPIVGLVNDSVSVSWGHGSSGTITAPYSAELIASELLNEISIGTTATRLITSPRRFLLRQQRRPNPFASDKHAKK